MLRNDGLTQSAPTDTAPREICGVLEVLEGSMGGNGSDGSDGGWRWRDVGGILVRCWSDAGSMPVTESARSTKSDVRYAYRRSLCTRHVGGM